MRVTNTEKSIKVVNRRNTIKLQHTGKTGPKGDTGYGIPAGGQADYILTKASGDDYDFEWSSPSNTFGDKHYEQPFSSSSLIAVTHNLNKYPSIVVFDSAGDEVEGLVQHLNKNSLTVEFSAPFTGIVSCN
tara:strand:+ start:1667 stop:2059 length:393 start_codon:yes stop_codon:yes gene_type:complete